MSVCIKVIKGRDYQVNICDKELIGKKINECTINKKFYGTESSEEKVIKNLKKATLINALGLEAVGLLKQVKGEVLILDLDGIPHSQFFSITQGI